MGVLHVSGGKREHLPEPVFILIGQYKENTQIKIKLQQFFDLR
jgi:hypothetical protein